VIICTLDKGLTQCVRGTRVVQLNRRTRVTLDEAGVIQTFGVSPASIPDYLALLGDAAEVAMGEPRTSSERPLAASGGARHDRTGLIRR